MGACMRASVCVRARMFVCVCVCVCVCANVSVRAPMRLGEVREYKVEEECKTYSFTKSGEWQSTGKALCLLLRYVCLSSPATLKALCHDMRRN